jgi:hypothetical protein
MGALIQARPRKKGNLFHVVSITKHAHATSRSGSMTRDHAAE